MAIQEISKDTEILPGKWICGQSNINHGLCSAPRKVVRISGDRFYMTDRHGEDEGSFITRKSALYLCDTQEEGQSLADISRANHEAIAESIKSITEINKARLQALVRETIPYNNVVVKIVDETIDGFDGHSSSGCTEGKPYSFAFRTNFPKRLLRQYLSVIEKCGFPDGTVGMSEKATGFNEDEGYAYVVWNSYGLFFKYGAIPDEVMEKYEALIKDLY